MEVLEIVVSIIASSSYGSLWRIRGGKEGGPAIAGGAIGGTRRKEISASARVLIQF
jgi:hypothetical protein